MESIRNSPHPGESRPILIFLGVAMLFAVLLNGLPNPVNAEGSEPVINFFIEREVSGHSDDTTALAWSSNGQWLASGSLDNSTIIWNADSWSPIKTLNHPAPVNGISFSRNSLRLAVSHGNGTIEIWNSLGWNIVQTLSDHTEEVLGLDWNHDGTKLSTGDDSGNIIIWDSTTWNALKTLSMPDAVNDVQWNNGGDRLAACSSDGTISIWDTASWSFIQNLSSGGYSAESIAWNPDDSMLAAGSEECIVRVWDTASWGVLQVIEAHNTPNKVRWSPDGSFLAASKLGGIQLWDASDWNVIESEEIDFGSRVSALAIHPDAGRIASGSPEETHNNIVIWTKNLSPVLDPIGNQSTLEDGPFQMIVSASDDDQLTFSDDTELFDIDPLTGEIAFVPTNDDVGVHLINITVADGKGGSDYEIVVLTVINVDDPPVAVPGWRYGADHVNITVLVGGQPGNSVALVISEDGALLHEITVARKSGSVDEGRVELLMDLDKSYEILLNYSGSAGENPVAVTFECSGISYTRHLHFDSGLGAVQVENFNMDDFFSAMGLVIFDATASVDVDNEIVKYTWDFRDGTHDDGEMVVHTFRENRNYNASLRIESDNGVNSTTLFGILLNEILDEEAIESVLNNDLTNDYMESSNFRAAVIDSARNLKLVDSRGKITGWLDGGYSFDIEGLHLAYASSAGEVYYIPNNLELTYNLIDSQKDYEVDIIVPSTNINKRYIINGERGVDIFELSEDANTLTIHSDGNQHSYSLRIEAESASGREIFTLTEMTIEIGAKHSYTINNWEDLTTDPKAVTLAIDCDNDGKIEESIDLRNGMTGEDVEAAIVARGKGSPSFLGSSGMILLIGFIGAAGIGFIIGGTEVGKLALISLFLPLYTRIRKEDVLDNETRGMIRGYIMANPGDNYNSIKRTLGLNNGALAYHLRVLEKAALIKSRQDGMFKRFYPAGMRIPQENGGDISEIQRILLGKIAESPGISQKEMANLLKLSKGVINYHVRVLLGKQLLRMEKRGRKTLCYPVPRAMQLIASPDDNKLKEA